MKFALPFLCLVIMTLGCTKPQDLEYVDFSHIRVIEMGLQDTKLGLGIRFFNPNNRKATLKKADVDVYINNQLLGHSTLDSLIQIPKKDTFEIPVILDVQTLSAATNLLQASSDTAILVKLVGNAQLGKAGIYKVFPINYQGYQKIKF